MKALLKSFRTAATIAAACAALLLCSAASAQSEARKIYETERAFEKLVAEKGIKAGFLEFMAPHGVMFMPEPVNARERWASRPESPAALNRNPVLIEVASNGLLAYSIGNSLYRPNGKDDAAAYYGHFISVWSRQPDGRYLAVFDTGINHEKPAAVPTEWKSPADAGKEKNDGKLSAADSSTGFWEMVEKVGSIKAYKTYLADDALLMREGRRPLVGKEAAVGYIKDLSPRIKFPKRKSFIESANLAYVYDSYSLVDKSGTESERGHFVQVWRLRGGKWLIAAEAWVPMRKVSNDLKSKADSE